MSRTTAEFGELLDRLIHERFGSRGQAAFARALDDAKAPISENQLSRVLRGIYPPPIESISAWTRVLGLKGREAESLRIAAELTLLPDDSLLAKKIERTDKIVGELSAENARLADENVVLRGLITTRAAPNPPATS